MSALRKKACSLDAYTREAMNLMEIFRNFAIISVCSYVMVFFICMLNRPESNSIYVAACNIFLAAAIITTCGVRVFSQRLRMFKKYHVFELGFDSKPDIDWEASNANFIKDRAFYELYLKYAHLPIILNTVIISLATIILTRAALVAVGFGVILKNGQGIVPKLLDFAVASLFGSIPTLALVLFAGGVYCVVRYLDSK